ncbi:hypothetical protein [Streptomyces microflavus]|uniref:hypothetical protein n=1 Tax=Streptomyces microflavus TaxID=1919 RepID=UPI002E326FDE|nr:hypothetical protein [Streptomyces microflavus]
MIRIWHEELFRLQDRTAVARREALGDLLAEVDRLRAELDKVTVFCAQRAEYVTSILNCHPDNAHDYYRWQGHAESRRQLSQSLGLPVAWPAETEPRTAPAPVEDEDSHAAKVAEYLSTPYTDDFPSQCEAGAALGRGVPEEDPGRCLDTHAFSPRDGWRLTCGSCDHAEGAPCHREAGAL